MLLRCHNECTCLWKPVGPAVQTRTKCVPKSHSLWMSMSLDNVFKSKLITFNDSDQNELLCIITINSVSKIELSLWSQSIASFEKWFNCTVYAWEKSCVPPIILNWNTHILLRDKQGMHISLSHWPPIFLKPTVFYSSNIPWLVISWLLIKKGFRGKEEIQQLPSILIPLNGFIRMLYALCFQVLHLNLTLRFLHCNLHF